MRRLEKLFLRERGDVHALGRAYGATASGTLRDGNACAITPGSPTHVLLNFWTGSAILGGAGCGPGISGDVMLELPAIVATGPIPWPGPGLGVVHSLPIPFNSSLCGLPVFTQGIWFDSVGPSAPIVLSWRLDLMLGS